MPDERSHRRCIAAALIWRLAKFLAKARRMAAGPEPFNDMLHEDAHLGRHQLAARLIDRQRARFRVPLRQQADQLAAVHRHDGLLHAKAPVDEGHD